MARKRHLYRRLDELPRISGISVPLQDKVPRPSSLSLRRVWLAFRERSTGQRGTPPGTASGHTSACPPFISHTAHSAAAQLGAACAPPAGGRRDTTDSMPSRFQTDCNDKRLEDATPSRENSTESSMCWQCLIGSPCLAHRHRHPQKSFFWGWGWRYGDGGWHFEDPVEMPHRQNAI